MKNGEGVARNYTEATKWYRKSAEQGDVYAQNNLGWMYQNGLGVEKDKQQARYWYQKAAEQGHEEARQRLKALGY